MKGAVTVTVIGSVFVLLGIFTLMLAADLSPGAADNAVFAAS